MSTEISHETPKDGTIVSVVVSLVSISIISSFLTQKHAAVKQWRRLPCAIWLVFGVYVDSFAFVFGTAVLKFGVGLDTDSAACDGAILLCLVAYVSTKLIYTFLVEKAYLIRGALVPRLRSKLWILNTFGMIGAYLVVIVLNFVFRIARLDEGGQCVIGMERRALLPLIIFDLVVNVYLTCLFFIPILNLYSFKNKERTGPTQIRKMAVRTLVGSLCTLTSSIVNLSVLTALNGEPGWVCLLCCNSDVLFSAIVLHWVTFNDHTGSHRSRQVSSHNEGSQVAHKGTGAPSSLNTLNISAVPPAHVPQACRCVSSTSDAQTLAILDDPQRANEDAAAGAAGAADRCLPLYHHGLLKREDSLEIRRKSMRGPENIVVVMRRAGMSPAV